MDWYIYPLVIGAGFLCGVINTLAGSGSLISLPLLMFLGLPADIANGTNRVAIVLQNASGLAGFHRGRVVEWKRGLVLAGPAVIGGLIGASLAVEMDAVTTRKVIGGLMVLMLGVLLVKPGRWLEERTEIVERRPGLVQFLLYFGIGIYGGFIQAGVGIFLLAGLVLSSGYDLIKANAIKLLVVFCFTVIALAVFAWNDKVIWEIGLTMAIGNVLGAWLATKLAFEKGAKFIRWVLIVVVVVAASDFLGVTALLKRMMSGVDLLSRKQP